MIIKSNFFKDTHLFFKKVSKKFILPNIGNLNKIDVSYKPDFSKVTIFDLLVENELVEYFTSFLTSSLSGCWRRLPAIIFL